MRRRECLAWLLATLAAGAGAGRAESVAPEHEIVAAFGQTPVYAEELRLHMANRTALVAVYFRRRFGADLTEDAWNRSFGGEVPAERLRAQALEDCLKDKAIQVLAVQRGVGELLPFPSFSAHCERVNAARRLAHEAGAALYGPVAYTPWQLYRHEVDNLRIRLSQSVSEDPRDAGRSDAALERVVADFLAAQSVRGPCARGGD